MTSFKNAFRAAVVTAITTTLLVACGGGDDPVTVATPPVTAQVPSGAYQSSDVASGYVGDLAAVPASTSDVLEPVVLEDQALAVNDSDEPATVN